MSKKVVFMFSGQGSQYYNAGKTLFLHNSIFRNCMQYLDKIAGEIIGESLLDRLYDDNMGMGDRFDRLLYTHPSIFMLEYSMAQVLLDLDIQPDFVLGASLGEFASAAVAGVLELKEILEAIIEQARVLEKRCPKGGMLAILGSPELYDQVSLIHENSQLVSINYSKHFVVSGSNQALQAIAEYLRQRDISQQLLPVTHAYHSDMIESAGQEYRDYLKGCVYKPSEVSFVSSVSGNVLSKLPHDYFWQVVRKPIEFSKAILRLEEKSDCIYIDLGPSGTLAAFAKQNLGSGSSSEVFSIMSPFMQEMKNLEKLKMLFCGSRLVQKY